MNVLSLMMSVTTILRSFKLIHHYIV